LSEKCWKLTPSDFAFLWEECKRCFYLKVARGFSRPRPIMPKIFTLIDGQMKSYFSGRRTESISPELPKGVVHLGEKWVHSKPISVAKRTCTCFIRGKFDTVVQFDDGSYGIIDFKTSHTKSEHILLYGRQLHAYALALENAAEGKLSLSPISKLGLLVYEPFKFSGTEEAVLSLEGSLSWIEIPRDDSGFRAFLEEVLAVLESPSPPERAPKCEWCQFRDTVRSMDL
jgi:hypothetical protein